MTTNKDELINNISELFEVMFQRAPTEENIENWIRIASETNLSFEGFFNRFRKTKEFQRRLRGRPGHPVGHFYSPVVNIDDISDQFSLNIETPLEDLAGLNISDTTQRNTFERLLPHIQRENLPRSKSPGRRYYTQNKYYGQGDGIILGAILAEYRPNKIIEIGSGFTTACMLDVIDSEALSTSITCIEPFPNRLRQNLLTHDSQTLKIIEDLVQNSDPKIYDTLDANDILFIDSTHVLKTGSDVCFEFFEILPRLKPGVIIHFHDIFYPFEYPKKLIFEKRFSWNEIYALRLFLMYNENFEVMYFNNYCNRRYRDDISEAIGTPLRNFGGGIWIKVLN